MWFGILGPLGVRADPGDPVGVGGPEPRALLTALLPDAGRAVPLDRLARILADAYRGGGWRIPELLDRLSRADGLHFDSISRVHVPSCL